MSPAAAAATGELLVEQIEACVKPLALALILLQLGTGPNQGLALLWQLVLPQRSELRLHSCQLHGLCSVLGARLVQRLLLEVRALLSTKDRECCSDHLSLIRC